MYNVGYVVCVLAIIPLLTRLERSVEFNIMESITDISIQSYIMLLVYV